MTQRPGEDATPDLTVVGIGASAGGLAALKTFFAAVPEDSGLAFVVVVHLSPDHESHLADLLQPQVKLPVRMVTETALLEANCVYVIPPNANLEAVDTHLHLSALEERGRDRSPIDHFFRTLARTHDGHAVGVVLTGTGSDGALGVKAIREKGGFTVVQAPEDAEYDGMPSAAIATGLVDCVLPLREIPRAIFRFAGTEPRVGADDDGRHGDPAERPLQEVFARIRTRTGRDFTRYKRSTILRRISRRMQLRHVEELADYLCFLREDAEETDALADDLLVTVTNFFRDPQVFEKLEQEVIPAIFAERGGDDDVRVWSVGCATGEEAYSLAMLLLEEAARREDPPRVQVFASDLHERSLERAREGFYAGDIENDLSAERLRRFFEPKNGGYRVRREVREAVVFASHNVLTDPPFSRLDLVSCRNLLIYLDRDVQRELVDLFHYALRSGGFLVIGASESVDRTELFRTPDKTLRIYRKRDVPAPDLRLPVFPHPRVQRPPRVGDDERAMGKALVYGDLHERLAELYAPPSLLVSPDDRVIHLSERAGRFLAHPGGALTANVFALVHEELRTELRLALDTARRRGSAARSRPIPVRVGGELRTVHLEARPAPDAEQEGFALVLFEEREPEAREGPTEPAATAARDGEPLRNAELEQAQQRLQALREEYDSSQEEMRASNEELQSANEELRSTLEELETSKEELQSTNEELQAVNQENRHKVEELSQLSDDLQNLFAATDIATLFLDRDLRILRFTPRVGALFNVRPMDRGRPLSDITSRLGYDGLQQDAEAVLAQLAPIEREVQDESGRWYLTRVLPYRSTTDQIAGVVVTFVDITERKETESIVREARYYAEQIIETLAEPLLVLTPDLCVKSANAAFYECFRASPEATEGRRIFELGNGQWDIPELRALLEKVLPHDNAFDGYEIDHVFESLGRRVMLLNGRRLDHMQLILLGLHDITERKRSEEALQEADHRKEAFLATLSHELRNPLSALDHGLSLLDAVGLAPERRGPTRQMMRRQLDQLVQLVDDLLDVSRISRGKLELRRERVELGPILHQALETWRPRAAARTLEVALPEEPLFLDADPTRLSQVFGNLLDNACKFTEAEGWIRVSAERSDGTATIAVEDDGIGIAPEKLAGIFTLFEQVDTSRERSRSGLGIGLTLVEHLVEMHGGSVEARSGGPGKGSAFVVRLPIVEGEPGAAAPRADDAPEPSVSGLRILVVEDNPDAALALGTLLEIAGNEVRTALDGEEAVRVAAEFHPDAVLLDIGLPRLDGFEVARRIRARPGGGGTALVAVTGWGQDADRRRSSEVGIDHHLVKPVEQHALWRTLAEIRTSRDARLSRS